LILHIISHATKTQYYTFYLHDALPICSHKDRHENIGFGTIGFEALNKIVHHEKLADLPKIMETPWVGTDKKNKKAPYGYEIAMRSEEHTSELQSRFDLVCRLLLEKKNK